MLNATKSHINLIITSTWLLLWRICRKSKDALKSIKTAELYNIVFIALVKVSERLCQFVFHKERRNCFMTVCFTVPKAKSRKDDFIDSLEQPNLQVSLNWWANECMCRRLLTLTHNAEEIVLFQSFGDGLTSANVSHICRKELRPLAVCSVHNSDGQIKPQRYFFFLKWHFKMRQELRRSSC